MRDPLRKYRIFVNNGKNICLYKDVSAQGDLISILVKVFRVIISFVRFDITFLEYVFVLSCIVYMYIYERENLLNIENKD